MSPGKPGIVPVQQNEDIPPENPHEPDSLAPQESQHKDEPQDSDSPEEATVIIPENHEASSEPQPQESGQEIPASIPESQEPQDPEPEPVPEEPEPEPEHIPEDQASQDDDITLSLPPEAWTYGDDEPDTDPAEQTHDWQERATGFTLSLDEPPPELWTHINDDDPEPDYEPTDSLQGAAYVQIHGRNFTERLHHTLKHRKERAEERAEAEREAESHHPYMQKAAIICGTLVMALGFALLALWFVGRETPDGMKRRAESFAESGKYDEAAEIYRRAHRRYPNDAEILAGLSEASRKAGHVQTAKTAHDEYIRLTSPDIPAKKEQPKPAAKTEARVKRETLSPLLRDKPLTFDDCMNEANHAYNIGMYTRALEYFSRAMKLNSRDYRPYIGLSASYRMKGWYVDSMHILDEMRRKFGRSPALDMEEYFLREAK